VAAFTLITLRISSNSPGTYVRSILNDESPGGRTAAAIEFLNQPNAALLNKQAQELPNALGPLFHRSSEWKFATVNVGLSDEVFSLFAAELTLRRHHLPSRLAHSRSVVTTHPRRTASPLTT